MMETYAERLQREELEAYSEKLQNEEKEKMTNYNFDEMKRREQEKVERNLASADYDGALGQTDTVTPEWNARRSDEDMTEKRREFAKDITESEKDKTVDIELELSDGDFLHLAKAAHERNITLNQLCVDVLKSSFNDLDYRFEHQLKPQLLNETK